VQGKHKKMQKILLSVLALLAFTFGGTAQTLPSYVPANGLVGWWPFNGNANDESGNNNNGTVNGATLTADRFGNVGKAYSFDGVSKNINIPNSASFQFNGGISVSVWIKSNNLPAPVSYVLSKGSDGGTGSSNSWMVVSYPNGRTSLDIHGTSGSIEAYVGDTLINNEWTNFTFTYNGSLGRAYKNGSHVSTFSTNASIFSNSSDLKIGRRYNSGLPYFFDGIIDDIAIYNRALTQQEITGLYQGANTTTNCPTFSASLTQGLVGYWPFCGNALDESGNGNHGTVNGATLTTDRFGNSGSAYNFDGINDFIQIPDNTSLDIQNSITISVWVKTSNTPPQFPSQSMRLVDKATGGTGDSYMLDLFQTDKVRFLVGNNGANTLPSTINYSEDLYNVVATHNGASAKIYINGVLNSETTISGQTPANSNPLRFGADSFLSGAFFKGSLDDIAIWNRALTPQEITQLYNQGICQTSITVTDTLLIHTGITSYNPVAYGNTLKVWPNPGNTAITLDAGNLALMQGWKIRISNAQGAQIYPATGQTGLISQQQQTLNMSGWGGNGLYFLYLIDPQNNIQEVKKIVLAP
jgi:hypothetical protein